MTGWNGEFGRPRISSEIRALELQKICRRIITTLSKSTVTIMLDSAHNKTQSTIYQVTNHSKAILNQYNISFTAELSKITFDLEFLKSSTNEL